MNVAQSPAITWRAEAVTSMGVSERAFDVECAGARIPGIVWSPEQVSEPRPLVLLGHGGSQHKRDEGILALARRFVRREGMVAAAIDATDHGERGLVLPGDTDTPEYAAVWQRPDAFDRMVADWQAALAALATLPEVDGNAVAYWGLSMGTMFGLPFVAAEPRIRAAVLGLCGLTGSSASRGRIVPRHTADAPRVRCPVLFLVQLEDERFDVDGALALFRLLGTEDKRLTAFPGLHAEIPPEGMDVSRRFLADALARPATPV